jgi:hypothetical protein
MLEDTAKTKACPFRVDGDENYSFTMQMKRVLVPSQTPNMASKWVDGEEIQEGNRCIGSKCMAWHPYMGDKGLEGQCKLIPR